MQSTLWGRWGRGQCLLSLDWDGEDSYHCELRVQGYVQPKQACVYTQHPGPLVTLAQHAKDCKNPRKLPEEPQCLKETFSGLAWPPSPCTSPMPMSHHQKGKGNSLPSASYRLSVTSLTWNLAPPLTAVCVPNQNIKGNICVSVSALPASRCAFVTVI